MAKKIAIICASWSTEIVNSAKNSCVETLKSKGYSEDQITVINVPGSLEIPLAGKMALDNGHDIAIGIGFVVDGQIYRHEFVAHTVVQSILDVQLVTDKPFLSAVLTPQSFSEHSDVYEEMYVKHMVIKGREAAEACDKMLDVCTAFKSL